VPLHLGALPRACTASDNKLEVVIEVQADKANAQIKGVNQTLAGMERIAESVAKNACEGIDGMNPAWSAPLWGPHPERNRRDQGFSCTKSPFRFALPWPSPLPFPLPPHSSSIGNCFSNGVEYFFSILSRKVGPEL